MKERVNNRDLFFFESRSSSIISSARTTQWSFDRQQQSSSQEHFWRTECQEQRDGLTFQNIQEQRDGITLKNNVMDSQYSAVATWHFLSRTRTNLLSISSYILRKEESNRPDWWLRHLRLSVYVFWLRFLLVPFIMLRRIRGFYCRRI